MSHPSICYHCGAEYNPWEKHACDPAEAFERISQLELEIERANGRVEALTTVLRRVCSRLGVEAPELEESAEPPEDGEGSAR